MRNLTVAKPVERARTRTIDDNSLPTTFSSPAKLLAQYEGQKLEHSKSSTDLKSQASVIATDTKDKHHGNGLAVRPSKTGMRRRSTLNWANESPMARQKLLKDAAAERRVDAFYSLHELGKGDAQPFYVSETKEKFMNPDFKFFDPKQLSSSVTRSDAMVVKVFARAADTKDFMLLLELDVYTASLVRIGKTVRHVPSMARKYLLIDTA